MLLFPKNVVTLSLKQTQLLERYKLTKIKI